MAMVRALGLMSGTSMDGIDLAVIESDGVRVERRGAWATEPYPGDLGERLRAAVAARRSEDPALEAAVTDAHADAIERFLQRHPETVELVGFHGQTVLHRPEHRVTRQWGDGARLARRIGLPVINDFRTADVAAGGEGAPLVPLYHQALARDLPQPLAILNLGGVANVTYLDGKDVLAFDTGPGNALIDDWVARHGAGHFDHDGRQAAAGRVDPVALGRLLDHSYFARKPPKSLDRNTFSAEPVASLGLADGAATLVAFTAAAVGRALAHLPKPPGRWLVGGGGRHNRTLMAALAGAVGIVPEPVEALGWPGDALEAEAFAFLAVRSRRGLPLSLPSTTGVPRPMPGGVLHLPPAWKEPS